MKKSTTIKHIFDQGFTTYHSDGRKSETYKNVFDEGYTTYYEDGRRTVSHKNVFGPGYTTYDVPSNNSFDFLYLIFAGAVVLLSVISLFELGVTAILSILLMVISVAARIILNKKHETTLFVLWAHPFALLGYRLLVNSMWANTKGNFLELFGVLFIAVGLIASLLIDCSDSFGIFAYAFITTIIMFVIKAYGKAAPYYMVIVMLVVALGATMIRTKIRKREKNKTVWR